MPPAAPKLFLPSRRNQDSMDPVVVFAKGVVMLPLNATYYLFLCLQKTSTLAMPVAVRGISN